MGQQKGCCGGPSVTPVRIGNANVGIVGLDIVLMNGMHSGAREGEELANVLLASVRQMGNYVPAAQENLYKQALLREYRNFAAGAGTIERADRS